MLVFMETEEAAKMWRGALFAAKTITVFVVSIFLRVSDPKKTRRLESQEIIGSAILGEERQNSK